MLEVPREWPETQQSHLLVLQLHLYPYSCMEKKELATCTDRHASGIL